WAEAVDQGRARLPEDRGRGVRGLVDIDRATFDAGAWCPAPATLGEPGVAQRARPGDPREAALGDRRLDVVAGAPAPGARHVSHPRAPPRAARAPPAPARPAPRAPPARPPASWRW